jgi:hypothetical protein
MGLFNKTKKTKLKSQRFDLDTDTFVMLRELTCQELQHYQKHKPNEDSQSATFLFDVLSKVMVDEVGMPIFQDAADCEANLDVGLSTMLAMQKVVFDLSGISDPKV